MGVVMGRSAGGNKAVRQLQPGERVRHNYRDGYGLGTVQGRRGDGSDRMAYQVKFDAVGEAMPYTFNADTQEIVPA